MPRVVPQHVAFVPSQDQLLWKKDPRFQELSKVKARDAINKRIRELVIDLVGKPPAGPSAANGASAGAGAAAGTAAVGAGTGSTQPSAAGAATSDNTLDALKKLQQQMDEVNAVLAKIESQLSSTKQK